MLGKVKIGDCCVGVSSGDIDNNWDIDNWGVKTIDTNNWGLVTNTNTDVRSYLSLDGLEDYTKRMKEMIDKKLEVINERLKKLEDGEVGGKFGGEML